MVFSLSSPALAEAVVRADQHWQVRHQEADAGSEKAAAPAFTIALSREAGTYGALIVDIRFLPGGRSVSFQPTTSLMLRSIKISRP